MTGVLERALGDDWAALHPKVRERYGLATDGDVQTVVGRGTMTRISHGALALPVLALGPLRNALFPESGTDVPFEIRTDAFRDAHGREAIAFRRTFETTTALGRDRVRQLDSTMVWDDDRGRVVDYLGTGSELAVELAASVDDGALVLAADAVRLWFGGRQVPLPDVAAVDLTVRDWYDEADERYRVSLSAENPLVGDVFAFEGSFTQATLAVDDARSERRREAVAFNEGGLPNE